MFSSLSSAIEQILAEKYSLEDSTVSWEFPQEASHGDIATPIALQCAKKAGVAPREIADVIVEGLSSSDDVHRIEVAGPGYVNIWLSPAVLLEQIEQARSFCTPQQKKEDQAPVLMDYSHPNIAKPLGVHHLLSTTIGQSLANVYRHLGYDVVSINHIGDWGTQFGKLAVALQRWGSKPVQEHSLDDLLELYVRFHDEVEDDASLDDAAREAFCKLENGDEELRAFWQSVIDITMSEMEKTYKRLHVHLDHVLGESFYEDKMAPIIEEGKQKGVFTTGENGALIAQFADEHMPPAIVLKADGATIYHTRDLATVRYRQDTWHPQSILYIVDRAQQLYFEQLFDMVSQLEWDVPHLEHVFFGRMRFSDKGMSTRKGNILKLEQVLDEAVELARKAIDDRGDVIQTDDPDDLADMMGIGAVVYGILSQNRKMDMVFDWEKILSFDGNSAPYLQYTHARARSLQRKAKEAGLDEEQDEVGDMELTEHDRSVMTTILQFPGVLEEARSQHMPHVLTNYLFGLCQVFNSFYNAEPILKAEPSYRALRLTLAETVADILKAGAGILTLRVPEKM